MTTNEEARDALEQVTRERDRLRDALKFYADPALYAPDKRYANEPWPIFDDNGDRARAALEDKQ